MKKYILGGCILLKSAMPLFAEQPVLSFKPFVKLQTWNAIKNDDVSSYIRRGRIGLNGSINDAWSVCTCLEFDNAGKDGWALPEGKTTDGGIGLWDLYASWRPLVNKQILVFTSGYTLPQLSREVMTKPRFISSLEKAKSSVFLRKFVTGKNNGISPMINLGGVVGKEKMWYEYNLTWIQAGAHYKREDAKANLLAGRMNIGFGSKPVYRYKKLSILPSSARTIVIGINGSYQGVTKDYQTNISYGIDAVGNYNAFKVSAEYTRMLRNVDEENYVGATGFCRLSYNKEFKKNASIEPSLTFSRTQYDENEFDLASGLSSAIDAGIDYYCYNKAVKVSFHYTLDAKHGEQNIKASDFSTEEMVIGLQFILK